MASRVTESMTSRTSLALVAEVLGDGRGDEAGADAERRRAGPRSRRRPRTCARPSGPSSCSMKSRTSRLRSPIRATTLTSAQLSRHMQPSSVLLPTPLPPKMPMRWPLPQVSRLSITRMPVTSGSVMCSRSSGPGRRSEEAVGVVAVERPERRPSACRSRPPRGRAARRLRAPAPHPAARPPRRRVPGRPSPRAASTAPGSSRKPMT